MEQGATFGVSEPDLWFCKVLSKCEAKLDWADEEC